MRDRAELNDETLRDGLQSPSVCHPSLEQKLEALHLMGRLGVDAVSLGLPGAGAVQTAHVKAMFKEVVRERLPLAPHCAARTKSEDLQPIADIIQAVGAPLETYAFLGTSPIRGYAQGWQIDDLLRFLEEAVQFAHRHHIRFAFVTEDTTRSRPEDLERLFCRAIDLGVRRLVLCDTVGYATPIGADRLVRFVKDLVKASGERVLLDWHGHNDRGLAVACSLAAEAAGVDRVHGTMLGAGERCGNAPLDQLLVHRHAMYPELGLNIPALSAYRKWVEEALNWWVSPAYPWPYEHRSPSNEGTGYRAVEAAS